uniref:Homeobox protein NANOG n=1 Tax=Nannospalax galili TaxID=1026970 RepID=A0A8C6QY22_NANGA
MSVDPTDLQTLPSFEKASNSGDSSPTLPSYGPEENDSPLQTPTAEMLNKETASPPSSVDSPDSSTSPTPKLAGSSSEESPGKKEESKVQIKKQKMPMVFSQAQLCTLNERFQKQKYLSLQQMQELSSILNLTYKQVKTWFQNQRMKCKRWQKSNWPKTFNSVSW